MSNPSDADKGGSNTLLYFGIFFFPLIFYWFLFRKGHSITSRVLWGVYAAFSTLIGLVIIGAIASAFSQASQIAPATYSQPAIPSGTATQQAPMTPPEVSMAAPVGQGFGGDQAASVSVDQGGAVRVSSIQLAQAFDQNEVAAQMQYKGKTLYVDGTVSGVTLDIMDNPVIQLEGANQFMPLQASFEKSYSQAISQISKGQRITVICRDISEVASVPMLDSCSL